jgi:hypothetical protein
VQNPVPAGTFVEVRLQKQSATVIHQVAQRRVQVLPCPIDQLGAVIGSHIRQLCKVVPDILFGATVLDLCIGKNLDDLLQSGNLAVVEAAIC